MLFQRAAEKVALHQPKFVHKTPSGQLNAKKQVLCGQDGRVMKKAKTAKLSLGCFSFPINRFKW
jgi:hypothetical protein